MPLQAGVNAPAESIVESLLREDTAAGFNISTRDVRLVSIRRVERRTLVANVSATLGVDLPPDADEDDIVAALEVQRLSADQPIELLSEDPDTFFGRTTQTLQVGVQPIDTTTMESRPVGDPGVSKWALVVPGIAGVVGGCLLVFSGLWRSRRCAPARQRASAWAHTWRVTPEASRYVRQP